MVSLSNHGGRHMPQPDRAARWSRAAGSAPVGLDEIPVALVTIENRTSAPAEGSAALALWKSESNPMSRIPMVTRVLEDEHLLVERLAPGAK